MDLSGGVLAAAVPFWVGLLQMLVQLRRSLQEVLQSHQVPLNGVSCHPFHRLLGFRRKAVQIRHHRGGYGAGVVPGRRYDVLPLILLHSEVGIDLPSIAARPALVIVLNLVVHLHSISAKLADLVRRGSFSRMRMYIAVLLDYVVLLGEELPDLVRRSVDGDALLYGYGGHRYSSFLRR
jgi:hypothetical protein